MASAMALEKLRANSPYLPSLEDLTRSRHSGFAMARISSSVFWVMFTEENSSTSDMLGLVPDQVIARRLLHGVTPVVVTRPARLLAEQRVLRDALGSAVTMLQFPRAQQLMDVLGGQAFEVFLHDLELLKADVQQLLVGHVADGDAAAILVHQLLQTLQALLGIDVVRVDVARHDLIAVDPVMLQGLVDLLLAAVDLLVGY